MKDYKYSILQVIKVNPDDMLDCKKYKEVATADTYGSAKNNFDLYKKTAETEENWHFYLETILVRHEVKNGDLYYCDELFKEVWEFIGNQDRKRIR